MSASNAFEALINTHIFQNTAIANVGDAAGLLPSATAGSLFVSLHTADPGEAGTTTTNETAYTGYARVAVARSPAAWPNSGANVISNGAAVLFPNCTAAPGAAVTHFGICSSASGAGLLLFSGALAASYQPVIGNAPNFPIGTLTTTTD